MPRVALLRHSSPVFAAVTTQYICRRCCDMLGPFEFNCHCSRWLQHAAHNCSLNLSSCCHGRVWDNDSEQIPPPCWLPDSSCCCHIARHTTTSQQAFAHLVCSYHTFRSITTANSDMPLCMSAYCTSHVLTAPHVCSLQDHPNMPNRTRLLDLLCMTRVADMTVSSRALVLGELWACVHVAFTYASVV